MKALTLWQPWASLVIEGVKTIETRSWPCPPTLIGERIAIHAAAKRPRSEWFGHYGPPEGDPRDRYEMDGCYRSTESAAGGDFLYEWVGPLGAVLGTARVIECVPIVDGERYRGVERALRSYRGTAEFPDGMLELCEENGISDWTPTGQVAYGDYEPGRYAWLLDKVDKFDVPIPAKGRQRVWEWTP